jgi:drug/metabolite transporter (DMT)-like permease
MAGILLVVQPPFLFKEGGDAIPANAALMTLFGSLCAAMGMVIIRMIGPGIDPLISGLSSESRTS